MYVNVLSTQSHHAYVSVNKSNDRSLYIQRVYCVCTQLPEGYTLRLLVIMGYWVPILCVEPSLAQGVLRLTSCPA